MKEIANTSDTALKDQSKDKLINYQKQLKFLLKGLKPCKQIHDDLLIKLIVRINANNLLR
jgi:hypothetical protein